MEESGEAGRDNVVEGFVGDEEDLELDVVGKPVEFK